MRIEEQQLLHWLHHFYGYGSWQARFWLIGYEEPGGDVPEEVADKFTYFYQHHAEAKPTLSNIRELYQHVSVGSEDPKTDTFTNRYEYRFGTNAIPSTVWKNLIAFEHGYDNQPQPDPFLYQKEKFAQAELKREALIPLYPLPGSHTHSWHYNWLNLPGCDFLKSQQRYEEFIYPQRIHTLLSKIREQKPEIVLMFGMKDIKKLKKSVADYFSGTSFTAGKGIKLQIPQHHRADVNGTTIIITTQIPALRHGRIETGFDWEEFGKRIKNANHTFAK